MLIRKFVFWGLIFISLCFSFWVYTLGTSEPNTTSAMTDLEFEGRKIWNQKNCIACHQVYGLGGYLGPDLTNVTFKKGDLYVKAILKSGTDKMPNFKLTDIEIDNVIEYLKYLNKTGSSNPKDYKINWYGSFEKK
jgi:nitric oxide reductase subunit C